MSHDRQQARRACWRGLPFRFRGRRFHCRHLPADCSPRKAGLYLVAGAAPGRETVVTLDFLDQGAVTEVVLTHEHLGTPERRALAEGGWPSLLDALAAVLSSSHLAF